MIRHISDRIAVMYLGKIVEIAEKEQLFRSPKHPYTSAFILHSRTPHTEHRKKHNVLKGDVPSPPHVYPGCSFIDRCLDAS